jgi:hypothetical protein
MASLVATLHHLRALRLAQLVGRRRLRPVTAVVATLRALLAPALERPRGQLDDLTGLLQARSGADGFVDEGEDHLPRLPDVSSSSSPQSAWTFFCQHQQRRRLRQRLVLAVELTLELADALLLLRTCAAASEGGQRLLPPLGHSGFVQPLPAQVHAELRAHQPRSLSHHPEPFVWRPVFRAAASRGGGFLSVSFATSATLAACRSHRERVTWETPLVSASALADGPPGSISFWIMRCLNSFEYRPIGSLPASPPRWCGAVPEPGYAPAGGDNSR